MFAGELLVGSRLGQIVGRLDKAAGAFGKRVKVHFAPLPSSSSRQDTLADPASGIRPKETHTAPVKPRNPPRLLKTINICLQGCATGVSRYGVALPQHKR